MWWFLSTAISVSPPPKHGGVVPCTLPLYGAAPVTHLHVLPVSVVFQIHDVSAELAPGAPAYMIDGVVGSGRRSSSKPSPLMPAIVGWPNEIAAGTAAGDASCASGPATTSSHSGVYRSCDSTWRA